MEHTAVQLQALVTNFHQICDSSDRRHAAQVGPRAPHQHPGIAQLIEPMIATTAMGGQLAHFTHHKQRKTACQLPLRNAIQPCRVKRTRMESIGPTRMIGWPPPIEAGRKVDDATVSVFGDEGGRDCWRVSCCSEHYSCQVAQRVLGNKSGVRSCRCSALCIAAGSAVLRSAGPRRARFRCADGSGGHCLKRRSGSSDHRSTQALLASTQLSASF